MNMSHSMDRQLDLLSGFDAMRIFLETRWQEGENQSDDLANLLRI
jgi:hypothetical protein